MSISENRHYKYIHVQNINIELKTLYVQRHTMSMKNISFFPHVADIFSILKEKNPRDEYIFTELWCVRIYTDTPSVFALCLFIPKTHHFHISNISFRWRLLVLALPS